MLQRSLCEKYDNLVLGGKFHSTECRWLLSPCLDLFGWSVECWSVDTGVGAGARLVFLGAVDFGFRDVDEMEALQSSCQAGIYCREDG